MINTEDADLWYEGYSKLDNKEKDKYIIETLKLPLSMDLIEEIDFMDFIIELIDRSSKVSDYENLIEAHKNILEINPKLIKEDFYYIDNMLIDYYLHKEEKEKVRLHLQSFISNPISSIDYLIKVIKKLCCYGYDDLAVELCEKTYDAVRNSDELIGYVETELSNIMVSYKIQKIYEDIRNSNEINTEKTLEYLKKYHRDLTPYIDSIIKILESNEETIKITIKENSKKYEAHFIKTLELYFCKDMLDKFNISFNVSSEILNSTIETLVDNCKINNSEYILDEYFIIDENNYEIDLRKSFDYITYDPLAAVRLAYGIHYVYDFIYFAGLISKDIYDESIRIINEKRKIVLKSLNKEAWNYKFICKWEKADSIEANDYIAEKDFIEKVFYEDIDFITYMPNSYMQTFNEIEKNAKVKEKLEREKNTVKKQSKTERNAPCPCKSGKKYKKCCGK